MYVGPGNMITITAPSGGLSAGDPYVVGQIPCVAATNIAASATGAAYRRGIVKVSVKAIDGSGNSAVAIGDQLYYVAADTPKINKKNTGVPFGKALGAVTAGSTATIEVILDE